MNISTLFFTFLKKESFFIDIKGEICYNFLKFLRLEVFIMLKEMLNERRIREIDDFDATSWAQVRESYKTILLNEVYGLPVPAPTKVDFEVVKTAPKYAAGAATRYDVMAHTVVCGKEFSFPFVAVIPNKTGKHPFFVHNDFDALVPSKYTPAEEIINNGFGVLSLCYESITSDDNDFTSGLAGILYPDGVRKNDNDTGKIAMWAWANMRVMDYALTLERLDPEQAAIVGHSRLGKTALVTGMLDERFRYVISNESGCSGAAITRGKVGETVAQITMRFPYWFCHNYLKYVDHEALTFDQHMLIATAAPRTVLVGSAIEDQWADPDSEYLACIAASKAWKNLGGKGFVGPDRLPVVGADFREGDICYHLRGGSHFFSRHDWICYMNTIREKMGK